MATTYSTLAEAEEVAADLVVRLNARWRIEDGRRESICVDIHILDIRGSLLTTYTCESDISEPLARFMAKESAPAPAPKGPETIDLTPTWSGILPALLLVLESGTAEGRKMARDELRRMAQAADQANAK
jgi:hypothetical protein